MGDTGSDTRTCGVRVVARSRYEPERSDPAERHFFFSYRIRIENQGAEAVQLLSRVWVVTDDDGHEQRVEGPGVVGETPVLGPGESFEYASFCPLETPVGTMEGHYVMKVVGTGERFEARIDAFTLAVPGAIN
jgi:ApaG protein